MMVSRLGFVCVIIWGFQSVALPSPAMGQESSAAIDLTHWKLTLPIDDQGKTKGKALEVSAADLKSGFTDQQYFFRNERGELVFWAPVTGTTTLGSNYPRSELREVLDPEDDNINWKPHGRHSLEATCRVLEVPSTQKVIVGQIHGFSGNAKPLIKLQYFNGKLVALIKLSPNADKETKLTFNEVGLGKSFTYQILLEDGKLTIQVNGKAQTVDILKNDPAWAEQTLYFKAGAYTQDNEGSDSEGGKVVFSRLVITHS